MPSDAVSGAAVGAGEAAVPSATLPQIKLLPVNFPALAGWSDDNHAAAFQAFRRSCAAVVSRQQAGESRVPLDGKGAPLAEICRLALARGERRIGRTEARLFFERYFAPHKIMHPGPPGLLTGYYEPIIEGSRVATARFRVPLYRRPPDLENIVAESARAAPGVPYTHMRRTMDGLSPYPTRSEIEAGALAGQGLELVWLADPVDAFFAQVQGSARIRLPDGSLLGITYDGKNGHPYTSIGRVLIDRGLISAESMTLGVLGDYLRADEARGREVMGHNASFVFFRPLGASEADAAQGALGTVLTPGRSLAIDASMHVLGNPIYVEAPALRHWGVGGPFRRLMIAQDVGSAIRGPERGDIYFGSGDRAGQHAGITKHAGTFHVLLPRSRMRRGCAMGRR